VKRYPKLIAEVLSPATEEFDRGDKFEDYARLDSLEEYVLIAQDAVEVECRRRAPGSDQWETEVYGPGDRFVLRSVGLEVAIADLYRGTTEQLPKAP
jgi:Uma2 family endonuclease